MTQVGLQLPSKQKLNDWQDISAPMLVSGVAKTVPEPILVDLPNESVNKHFEYMNTGLDGSMNVQILNELHKFNLDGAFFIDTLYSRRCLSKPLANIITTIGGKSEQISAIAQPYFDEIFKLLYDVKMYCQAAIAFVGRHLSSDIWARGLYSDVLIDEICMMIYKLVVLDEIRLTKSASINDLTTFGSFLTDKTALFNASELRMWFSTTEANHNDLIASISGITPPNRKILFDVFYSYLQNALEKADYIHTSTPYAYIAVLRFFVQDNVYKLDPKTDGNAILFIQKIVRDHPIIPLVYEMSLNIADSIRNIPAFSRFPFPPIPNTIPGMSVLHSEFINIASSLPAQFQNAAAGTIPKADFYKYLCQVLHFVAQTKNSINQLLVLKLISPPAPTPETANMSSYERSLRNGFSSDERKLLIQLIALWRQTTDMLRANSATILKVISPYIFETIENFLKNVVERSYYTAKRNKTNLEKLVQPIREAFAGWKQGEEMNFRAKSKKDLQTHPLSGNQSHPPPALIEFIRIQIQTLINKGGVLNINKSKAYPDKILNNYWDFINESKYFTDVLNFDAILNEITDQSFLYFKEVQLDLNQTVSFPIRASLPFILCEYALDNYSSPEITELIFYPLGIYNDAMNIASNKLRCSYIADEIKAEASMCLMTLKTLIADFTFGAFQTYTALRFLPPNAYQELKQKFLDHWPDSRAYRMRNTLQQNSFYLLGKQIDLRSLIIGPIDNDIRRSIAGFYNAASKMGPICLPSARFGLYVLRETHRQLKSNGFQLLSFDELIREAIGDCSPNSFSSKVIDDFCNSTVTSVTSHYFCRSVPTQLIPQTKKQLRDSIFGSHHLGRVIKAYLEPTMNNINCSSFEAYVELFGLGAVAILNRSIINEIDETFNKLTASYTSILERISRIADASVSSSGPLMFDRYEGAYRYYMSDKACLDVFKQMKKIGNLIMIGWMLDVGICNNKLTREHVMSYFQAVDLNGMKSEMGFHAALGETYDKIKEIMGQATHNTEADALPGCLSQCLMCILRKLNEYNLLFNEPSTTVLDFPSLKGFGAIYSVLEFVFCLHETFRNEAQDSPFESYGEGVMCCAAAFLALSNQERHYNITCIGRKLKFIREYDFSSQEDPRLTRFCAAFELASSSLQFMFSLITPIADQIRLNA